jgi:hypothetical protein
MNYSLFLTIILLILAIVIPMYYPQILQFYKSTTDSNIQEGFEVYQQLPFGYFETGSEPLSYYRLDRYRSPYRYPDVFMTNYPVPYYRYYD